MTGRKHSAEARLKMSLPKKGKPAHPNTVAAMHAAAGNYWIGRKHTDETKEKMAAAKRGRPSGCKGKPCSEESKAKYRQTMAAKAAAARRERDVIIAEWLTSRPVEEAAE